MRTAVEEMVGGKYMTLKYDSPAGPSRLGTGEVPAYIFVDGKMMNEELLRLGLGKLGGPVGAKRYQDRLRKAQQDARDAPRGMWANYN